MRPLIFCLLFALSAEAVMFQENDGFGRNGNVFANGGEWSDLGPSASAEKLKRAYACLDGASRLSVTNALGVKNAEVVQLLARAESLLSEAATVPKAEPWARVGLASVHLARGDIGKALTCVDEGLVKDATNISLLCCRGQLLKSSGRIDEALAAFRKASSCDPASPLPCRGLADLLISIRRFDEAATLCDEARKRWPNDETLADLALKALVSAARFEEAKNLCSLLADAHPQWIKVIYRRGQVLSNTGKPEQAIHDFEEVLKRNPSSCDAYNEMGTAWAKMQNYQKSLTCYEAGLRVHPSCFSILRNMATSYWNLGKYDAALDGYRRALAIRPSDVDVTVNMASLYLCKNEADVALGVCTNALASQPGAWILYFKACECLGRLGRQEDALSYAEKGLAAAPHEAEAWFLYGNTLIKYRQYPKAAEAYAKAARLNPNDARYLSCQAIALYNDNRFEQSVDVCRAAHLRFPGDMNSVMLMAQGLEQLKRPQEAAEWYARISATKPRNTREKFSIDIAKAKLGQINQNGGRAAGAGSADAPDLQFVATNASGNAQSDGNRGSDREAMKSHLSEIIAEGSAEPEILVTWAAMAMKWPQAKEREAALQTVLSRGAGNAKVLYWSGHLAMSLGRPLQAITNWTEAIRLAPDYAPAYRELGKAESQVKKNPQGALKYFQRSAELTPNDPAALCDLGYTYYLCKSHTNAICELQKAVAIDSSLGIAWYNLALAKLSLGQFEGALADVRKAKEAGYPVDPNFMLLLEGLTAKKRK